MLKFSRRCSRCGVVESAERCKERHFLTSFNEVLCDECVTNLIKKGQIAEIKDDEGNVAFKQNLENLYKRVIELEETNATLESEIYKNKRMLRRLERIKDFVEMKATDRD